MMDSTSVASTHGEHHGITSIINKLYTLVSLIAVFKTTRSVPVRPDTNWKYHDREAAASGELVLSHVYM
jgi:hypothetical protein